MIAAILLAAAPALAPGLQEKILAAFAPGDAPRSLSLLLEVRFRSPAPPRGWFKI